MSKKKATKSAKNISYCSFCGKPETEVRKIIFGPTVCICDDCVELCDDIVIEDLFPDRIVMRVKVPNGTALDEVLYETVAAFLSEKYPGIDLRYECKTVPPGLNKNNPVQLRFSFGKAYGSSPAAKEAYNDIESDLADSIARISVLQEQYYHANSRIQALNAELTIIKSEYLEFLRNETKAKALDTELSAVMFIDVKGFSKFGASEKKRVLDLLRGIVPVLFNERGGQNVNMWGDGIVAIFSDVNKAIECGVKFIRHLNVEYLEARIGMSWGQIRVNFNPAIGRTDIDGASVDRAARLEPMAEPGEILLSSEFAGHQIDPSLGQLVKVTLPVKKAFANYNVGDKIEALRLKILVN